MLWVSWMCGAALNLPEEKAFESTGGEPVFPEKDQAIDYAQNRGVFSLGRDSRFGFDGKAGTHHCVQRSGSEAVIARDNCALRIDCASKMPIGRAQLFHDSAFVGLSPGKQTD